MKAFTKLHETPSTALRKICIHVDGSQSSLETVNWFLTNVYKTGDYLIFVYVNESPHLPTVCVDEGLSVPTYHWNKKLQDNIDQTNKLRNEYGYLCESRRIPHDFAVMNGSRPGDGIIQAVEQYNANMIVMGCRGLGAIKRAFIGSVSDYVLHHADVPCIIVPSQGQ
ncbi:hypothetical protein CRM22_004795 [Opisthorchis felineus]|uniref:UspA domain-containing protein n=1 Tax=Opisthorchis felineus TaxID=147828 RepID=A0A4V3SF86_OPIFE|nr:hypothetical protein CRM22_004795 [Opisthorchis felineus]